MFEWDKSKANENHTKHGISFADTFAVFEDPNALTVDDFRGDEQRYVTIGIDDLAEFWWWFTHGEGTTSGLFLHARLYAMR